MAEVDRARRGVMAVSSITGGCTRLLRAGRRRISLVSAIIVVSGLLAAWGVAAPAGAATKAVTVKTTSLPAATAGVSYSAKLAASGGTAPYTWSVTQGALPTGLTLVPTTGLIAGIPAPGSSASFTVQASDSENPSVSASASLSITVTLIPLAITTTSLPAATADVSYSAKLAGSGGILPYTWSVASGALPAGLSLNPANGAISGKPTAPGTAVFTVGVSDGENPPAAVSADLSITVSVASLAITTVSVLPSITTGVPYSVKLAAAGGLTPYSWSITQGSLPAGLKLHAATGVISGTPSGGIGAGEGSTFTAQVSDAENPPATASAAFSLDAAANTVTVTSPGDQVSVVGDAVNLQIAASDSDPGQTLTYSATGLPDGLSIDSSGLISGTPTTSQPYSVTVAATDGTGASGSATFTWTVNPPPPLTCQASDNEVNGQIGDALTATLTVSGGNDPTGPIYFELSIINGGATLYRQYSVTADGDGTYTSPPVTAPFADTYSWQITSLGDLAGGGCDFSSEVSIGQASPTLQGSATEFVSPTQPYATDTVTVSGGYNPTGTITFSLYAVAASDVLGSTPDGQPVVSECSDPPQSFGVPVFTDTLGVGGDGSYASQPYAPSEAGVYFYIWVAAYSGDSGNFSVNDTPCQGYGYDPNQVTDISTS